MSRLIDLTGQKFYEWTVIKKADPSPSGRTRWLCRCSCGKIGIVGAYDLKNGKHRSCGHDRKHNIKNLANQVFGELTAIEYAGNGKWKCKCSCGKEVIVSGYDLTSGHTKSCGHNTNNFIDLTGQTFGEWTVLEYVGNHLWKCKCSCGKISNVHSYSLRSGGSKSCGHDHASKKLENLKGKQFNDWTALEYVGNSSWRCRCTCGKEGIVAAYDLKNGKSRNCGHNRNKPYRDLTGMTFGNLTVHEYIAKGKYRCKCKCGKELEVYGSNLLSGGTLSCGCLHKSIYTRDYLIKVIQDIERSTGERPYIIDIAIREGITTYYVTDLIKRFNLWDRIAQNFKSSLEKEIYNSIRDVLGKEEQILTQVRSLVSGFEADIYIPSKKLAVEVNGAYWHSSLYKDKNYHKNKTMAFARAGIRLINIFDYEWGDTHKQEILLDIIRSNIGNNQRIYARKCILKNVGHIEATEFIDKYHLQGNANAQIAYGLYIDDKLMSIMTFGKPRFTSDYEWELIRYCVKPGYTIVGGAQRLFKHFIEENSPNSIVSYCDISKFNGRVYKLIGMSASVSDFTDPGYVWYNLHTKTILSRYKTQKAKLLSDGLSKYGDTESEIMSNLGYIKIYDSGNLRWSWYKCSQ